MSNRNLINNDSLPKSRRTYLCLPKIEESAEFLSAVKESIELHHPWVEAPSSEEKFEQYIQRINFDSHLGFFIRQRSDRQLIGVVNINEIVKGVFQSGYLGFYAFKKHSGQGLMTEGLTDKNHRAKFKDLTVRIFEKSGHTPSFEETEVFNSELLGWANNFKNEV